MKFVSALIKFEFFYEYQDALQPIDWVALAISADIKFFSPYSSICQIWEIAVTVYLNIQGDIGVVTDRRNRYTKDYMKENRVAFIKPGTSFGEIGVLYGSSR